MFLCAKNAFLNNFNDKTSEKINVSILNEKKDLLSEMHPEKTVIYASADNQLIC